MLAIIPARSGSKGLPGKNIRLLDGRPLIAYAIIAAQKAKMVDRIIVSTDSQKIAEIAKEYGAEVPFLRPEHLAKDISSAIDVYLYTIDKLNMSNHRQKIDEFMVLQPTSPLRDENDINSAVDIFVSKKADAVISVCESAFPINWAKTIDNHGRLKEVFKGRPSLKNRQAYPKYYIPNGAIFILKYGLLKARKTYYTNNSMPYIMPRQRSVDIDDLFDFEHAEYIIRREKMKGD